MTKQLNLTTAGQNSVSPIPHKTPSEGLINGVTAQPANHLAEETFHYTWTHLS